MKPVTVLSESKSNDKEACLRFDYMYRKFYKPLVKNAAGLLGSEVFAQDIVQDVFLKYWTIFKSTKDIKDAKCFLYRMTFNSCMDQKERRQKAQTLFCDLYRTTISASVTQEMIDAIEFEKLLSEAIALLSPKRKLVFILGRREGWKREKIAEALGISEETARETMRQALKIVKNYIGAKMGRKVSHNERIISKKTPNVLSIELERKVA